MRKGREEVLEPKCVPERRFANFENNCSRLVALRNLATACSLGHAQSQPPPENILLQQSQADADRKSSGCVTCHTSTDSATMHPTGTVRLGCIDCHGGNAEIHVSQGGSPKSAEYERDQEGSPSSAQDFALIAG